MTRNEKIVEILQKYIFADGDIHVIYDLKKMYDELLPVLALPIEVPGEDEIGKKCKNNYPYTHQNWLVTDAQREAWLQGFKAAIEEIKKRNQ